MRLPEAVSFHEGALVEPLAVGLNAVAKARLEPGDAVLIVGAGPVGIAVALWCRFFGARHIVVSDLIGKRAERAIDFGATAMIDASREDVRSRVQQLAGGQPRVVFDCVGVPGSLQLAIDYAPFDARVVVVGLCMAADRFFPAKAMTKELDLTFVFVYRRRDFEIVVDLLGRGRIGAAGLVTDRVGFDTFCRSIRGAQEAERSDQGHARAALSTRITSAIAPTLRQVAAGIAVADRPYSPANGYGTRLWKRSSVRRSACSWV